MTPFRWTAVFLMSLLLSVGLVAVPGTAAQSVAQRTDPGATTLSAPCYGGPGWMFFTVHPPAADGTYQVDVTARRLVEGSRWKIAIELDASEEEDQQFRRRAVNGEWSVTTQVAGPSDGDQALFQAGAKEVGARHRCLLFNSPSNPTGGIAPCNSPRRAAIIVARRLDDDTVRVVFFIFDNRASATWHLELTAKGAGTTQTVAFDDLTNKRRILRSRVDLQGVDNPRLRMVATRTDGRQCRVRLNPPNVMTPQPLAHKDIGKLARRFAAPH